MKHISKQVILALCFCMALGLKAQEEDHILVECEQHIMTAFVGSAAVPGNIYIDSLAQTFHKFSLTPIYSVSLSVYDAVGIEDGEGSLAIISGSDPYGPVVFEALITIPGLNKFVSDEVIAGIGSYSDVSPVANAVMNDINTGVLGFDDVKTEYALDLPLPPGDYCIIISTDGTDLNEYPDGSTHAPWLIGYANCGDPWICGEAVLDPYQSGHLLQGGGMGMGGAPLAETVNFDMAFEVKVYKELSTGIGEETNGKLVLPTIVDGQVSIPSDWAGGNLSVFDGVGRQLYAGRVFAGQNVRLEAPTQQLLFRLEQGGRVRSAKVTVVGF